MRTLKLMRLVGAMTLVAAAPVIGAIAVYAQTSAPDASAPAAKPSGPSTGAPAGRPSGNVAATGPAPVPGQIVMASDGQRVGEVAGVKSAPDGKVQEIHIKTGGFLGFGSRTVAVPFGSFAVSGQNVQLSLTSTDVGNLPSIAPDQG
jgi:hypothetical protein